MTEQVFVYGSLKRGFGNHGVIRGQEFVGEGETSDNKWDMFSMGGYPGVIYGEMKISGEIYEVDEEGMKGLDRLEGNGSFYTREVIETTHGKAWMYVLPERAGRDNKSDVEEEGGVLTWMR